MTPSRAALRVGLAAVFAAAAQPLAAASFELRVTGAESAVFSGQAELRANGQVEVRKLEGTPPQSYGFAGDSLSVELTTRGPGKVTVQLYRDGGLVAQSSASGRGRVLLNAGGAR